MTKVFIEIRHDGKIGTHLCSKSDNIPLERLQQIVRGNIATVPSKIEGAVLIVDADAKNDGLPRNDTATDIVAPDVSDWIAGTAVWAKVEDGKYFGFDRPIAGKYIKDIERRRRKRVEK